jgi:O-antigen/teichoic acid export membrane protein
MQPHAPLSRLRNRRILLASGAGIFQRIAQLAAALISLPLVLHALGVAGFGVWGAATSLAWLIGILDFGLGAALVSAIPGALAAGPAGETQAQAFVAASLAGGCGVMLLFLLPLVVLAGFAPAHLPGLPFLIAWGCLAVNVPLSAAANIWFGLQKGHVAGGWDFVQNLAVLALLLAGVFSGGGVALLVACVYGGALLANAGSLTHLLLTEPRVRPRWTGMSRAVWRRILGSGLLLFSLSAVASLAYALDNVLALAWAGPAASAQMAVAMRLCVTAAGFIAVATHALWPAFVEAISLRDFTWVWRSLLRATGAIVALAAGGSALVVAFGGPVLHLWLRTDMRLPPDLFWAMAAWISVLAIPRVAGLLLNAAGVLRAQIAVQAAAAALALAAKYLLAPRFGVAGILAATPLVWAILVCPVYAWLTWRWINVAKQSTNLPAPESR